VTREEASAPAGIASVTGANEERLSKADTIRREEAFMGQLDAQDGSDVKAIKSHWLREL